MHKVRQETSVLKMLMQNTMGEFYLGGRSKYLLQMLFFSFLFVFCFFCFELLFWGGGKWGCLSVSCCTCIICGPLLTSVERDSFLPFLMQMRMVLRLHLICSFC
jgi:hypothetical protein